MPLYKAGSYCCAEARGAGRPSARTITPTRIRIANIVSLFLPPGWSSLSGLDVTSTSREKWRAILLHDKSRRNGRWHTCTLCRKRIWAEQEKPRLVQRGLDERRERSKYNGLDGLRHLPRSGGLASLPPPVRFDANRIISRSRARAKAEGRHLSQPQTALLIARAVSNAKRVGDRSWSRKMRRLKGYKRAERRRAQQEAVIASLRQARTATKEAHINWQLRPW
jgi:hypothetical protein